MIIKQFLVFGFKPKEEKYQKLMNFKKLFPLFILLLLITNSCMYSVDDFTKEELKWTKPFNKNQTIIFTSEKGEVDTIIYKQVILSNETVNDLERGFYKSNYLSIPYEFTKGSYHQFDFDGTSATEQDFVSIEKSSAGFGSMEISFIGLLFNEDEIEKAKKINTNTYQFDSLNATAKWVNIKKGIKSFTFNTDIGILSYIDERDIKWIKK